MTKSVLHLVTLFQSEVFFEERSGFVGYLVLALVPLLALELVRVSKSVVVSVALVLLALVLDLVPKQRQALEKKLSLVHRDLVCGSLTVRLALVPVRMPVSELGLGLMGIFQHVRYEKVCLTPVEFRRVRCLQIQGA